MRRRSRTVDARWRSFREIVRLWVDLFDRHGLLTPSSAIALQALIAVVAFALLGLGILGAFHDTGLWSRTGGPAISGRVLPDVYRGIDEVVRKVLATSSGGLVAFAAAFAVWELSGVVRASSGALNRSYGTDESRPWWVRFPLLFALAAVLIVAWLGAIILAAAIDVPGAWGWPLAVARWLGAISLLLTAFGLLVRWAPAERRATRRVSAGAVLVVAAWIVETLTFKWYVTSAADFRTTIGSFVAFLVVTSFLYVGAIGSWPSTTRTGSFAGRARRRPRAHFSHARGRARAVRSDRRRHDRSGRSGASLPLGARRRTRTSGDLRALRTGALRSWPRGGVAATEARPL